MSQFSRHPDYLRIISILEVSLEQTEQFAMRLPPTAKSGLCQQRAREQLVYQKKENKQKRLFE